MATDRRATLRAALLAAYADPGLWGETDPAWPLPAGVERGDDPHLAYLTLVYTISGGRDPGPLWEAARRTFANDPELFAPQFLAYAKPALLRPRLQAYGLAQKPKSEATVWQRIGQALVMRAGGSVRKLLADHGFDATQLLAMLAQSKTTFPVLSGAQTAPRWLHGLAAAGAQPLIDVERLAVPVSPAGARALEALSVGGSQVSVEVFGPLDALGRRGCARRQPSQAICPAAAECPVAGWCQYGGSG